MTAIERVSLEPAFVLHGRAYRETSEILDLLTRNHGCISLVARGMRRSKAGLRAILQPFQPVTISFSGRGSSLMTLQTAESGGPGVNLQGTSLMSAFYANELVLRFLHKGDPHPQVFARALEATGATPEEVLFVGDSMEADVRGPVAYGFQSLLVDRRASGRHQWPSVTGIDELVGILSPLAGES